MINSTFDALEPLYGCVNNTKAFSGASALAVLPCLCVPFTIVWKTKGNCTLFRHCGFKRRWTLNFSAKEHVKFGEKMDEWEMSMIVMFMKKLRASDRLKTSAFLCNTSAKLRHEECKVVREGTFFLGGGEGWGILVFFPKESVGPPSCFD